MRRAIANALRLFFNTTTLHGFKYLHQGCYYDRVAWTLWCLASACCAGVLCAVVWARFLQVPALLALRDLRTGSTSTGASTLPRAPLVALCPAHAIVARQMAKYLSLNPDQAQWLPAVLGRLLHSRLSDQEQLVRLATALATRNATLREALTRAMPGCGRLALGCRWRGRQLPCDSLLHKDTTKWGACCLLDPQRLPKQTEAQHELSVNEGFTFALDFSLGLANNGSTDTRFSSCFLVTRFGGEQWSEPALLVSGREYYARLRYTAVRNPRGAHALLDATCDDRPLYSYTRCMVQCREWRCGCFDPLRLWDEWDEVPRPARAPLRPCSVLQMGCLRSPNLDDNMTCTCKPSCNKQISDLGLESTPLNALPYALGPMYENLNPVTSTLLNVFVRTSHSRLFERLPTESWLTLLSSLGGVFNMFLGVGLFSALELLFLVFARLPLALKRSTELEKPPSSSSAAAIVQSLE